MNSFIAKVTEVQLYLDDDLEVTDLFIHCLCLETDLDVLVFEEGAFAFEVGGLEPAQSLAFCYGPQGIFYLVIVLDLSSFVIFVRWVEIGRICKNGRYFALLKRSHRFGKAVLGLGDRTY